MARAAKKHPVMQQPVAKPRVSKPPLAKKVTTKPAAKYVWRAKQSQITTTRSEITATLAAKNSTGPDKSAAQMP